MILGVYTIFDTACSVADRPMVARSDGELLRVFSDLCVSAEHRFGQHPEHYSLFKIGEFDDTKMFIVPLETGPECLATGIEMVKLQQKVAKENGELDAPISDGALV